MGVEQLQESVPVRRGFRKVPGRVAANHTDQECQGCGHDLQSGGWGVARRGEPILEGLGTAPTRDEASNANRGAPL